MDLKSRFEQAVADSKNLTDRPSNDTLLQLYSYYKQATEGDINVDPPSNPFDFVSKAKFEAWAALKGKTRENAMEEYVELIEKLKG
jgi:diazepam-binding inhibitor (GABA receptor modulator, acyl-CoA-binding protein)